MYFSCTHNIFLGLNIYNRNQKTEIFVFFIMLFLYIFFNFYQRKQKSNKITWIGVSLLNARSANLHLFPWVPLRIHTTVSASPGALVINFNEPVNHTVLIRYEGYMHILDSSSGTFRILKKSDQTAWLCVYPWTRLDYTFGLWSTYQCCCQIRGTRSSHMWPDEQAEGSWRAWLLRRCQAMMRQLFACSILQRKEEKWF